MSELYINEYSDLPKQERRQLSFKRQFKKEYPQWNDSMIILRDLINEYVPKNTRVLDIGCGHGNFVLDELKNHFSERIGLDVSEDVASGNTSVDNILIGNAESIDLLDTSVDLILSLWVMEHVINPDIIFKEMTRILRPNGYIAFVTPNAHALIVMMRSLLPFRFAKKIVRKLYGRSEQDTFPIQYRSNTIKKIRALAQMNHLDIIHLAENVDPSYTSFEKITYNISAFLSTWPTSLFKPHLIVLLKKSS